MKRMILLSMVMLISVTMLFVQSHEGLTEYKLSNGLTVMLWEDHDQPDVTGYVAVRAGAIDEPAEYTEKTGLKADFYIAEIGDGAYRILE